jgi:hypothetical protein
VDRRSLRAAPPPYTLFHPRGKRDWNRLLDELGGSGQLAHCLEIARHAGTRTVLVEERYVDADYRSEFSAYWSNKFQHGDGFARRAHFFTELVHEDQVHAIPEDADYVGYIVLRPLPEGVVGRTILRLPNTLLTQNPTLAAATDIVSVFGTRLKVTGTPFCTQDAEYLRCAHVAAWICQYSAHLRGLTGRHLTADLVAYAPAELSLDRRLPSDGLNDEQMQAVLSRVGIPALTYAMDQLPTVLGVDQSTRSNRAIEGGRQPHARYRAATAIICRYVRSGFPVLVNTERHIFAIVGYLEQPSNRRNPIRFLAADDQVGPYEIIDIGKTDPRRGEWQVIQIPLPAHVWLSGESAENDAYTTLSTLQPKQQDQPIPIEWSETAQSLAENKCRLQTTLLTARNYKRNLPQQHRPDDAVKRLRLAQLPRWVWVVEAHDETARLHGEPSVIAEIVYDYTSSTRPRPLRLAVSHQGALTIYPPDSDQVDRLLRLPPGRWISHDTLTRSSSE